MGLFDFLFGSGQTSTVQVADDQIWMTQQAKWEGIRRETLARSAMGSAVILLVAHFPDTQQKLYEISEELPDTVPVRVTLAEQLSLEMAGSLQLEESLQMDLIVAERHLLASADEKLQRFAGELPCHCRIIHHVSLEDPLIRKFAGDWMENLLRQLGMKSTDSIQSGMVMRRVKAAQQKLEQRATSNESANSAAEWIELNLPPGA